LLWVSNRWNKTLVLWGLLLQSRKIYQILPQLLYCFLSNIIFCPHNLIVVLLSILLSFHYFVKILENFTFSYILQCLYNKSMRKYSKFEPAKACGFKIEKFRQDPVLRPKIKRGIVLSCKLKRIKVEVREIEIFRYFHRNVLQSWIKLRRIT
jgi:hypothetical protein